MVFGFLPAIAKRESSSLFAYANADPLPKFSSQKMEKILKATHAYVVVYFKDETGIKVLSGRERAVFRKGMNRLFNNLKNPQKIYEHIQNKELFWELEGASN